MFWKKWLSLLLCGALAASLLLMPVAALSAGAALETEGVSAGAATAETAQPEEPEPTPAPETATPAPEQPTAAPATGQPTATPATEQPAPTPAATATPAASPTPTPTVAPATPENAPPTDVQAFYDTMLGAADAAVLQAYLDGLSDERFQELWNQLTDEQKAEISERLSALLGDDCSLTIGPTQLVLSAPALAGLLAAPMQRANLLMALDAEDPEEASGLHLDKKVAYDATTDSYTLTLEAYARGTVETSVGKPTDLVLVLDTSGSMGDSFGMTPVYADALDKSKTYFVVFNGSYATAAYNTTVQQWRVWGRNTVIPKTSADDTVNTQFYQANYEIKLQALKTAVGGFLDQLAAQNPEITNPAQRNRVSIVTFGQDSAIKQSLTAISPTTVDAMKTTVNGLTANGATPADVGMKYAQTALLDSDDNHNKVVIFFSDGEPTTTNVFSQSVASGAVTAARSIKGAGGTVYTIGIMGGAQPFAGDGSFNTSDNINAFMHALSSNYPAATWNTNGTRNLGTPASLAAGESYYLTATDSASLSQVFLNISQQIPQPGTTLDGSAVLQDVLTREFLLPEGYDAAKIELRTQNYSGTGWTGAKNPATGVSATVADDRTIRVTGFDYTQNYISETSRLVGNNAYWGSRLIVTVPGIKPDYTVTYGGQSIPTNADGSGVYPNAEKAAAHEDAAGLFATPVADVAIRYTPTPQNQYVYLTNAAALGLLLGQNSSQPLPNGTNNAYVTTAYTLKDAAGNLLGTFTVLAGDTMAQGSWAAGSAPSLPALYQDTHYTLDAVLTSVNPTAGAGKGPADGSAASLSKTDTANAWVLAPRLTYQDSLHAYGSGAVDYAKENRVGEATWFHGTDTDTAVAAALTGTKPTLTENYDPAAEDFSEEQLVTVKVLAGGREITGYTTLDWQAGTDCPEEEAKPETGTFRVHVCTATLTIKKAVENPDANQSFVFTVTGPAGQTRQVAVQGAGSVTIAGLPIGSYTVAEDTNWSWRYLSTDPTQSVTLTRIDNTKTVTVHNTRHNPGWLSWETYALNRFCHREDGAENEITLTGTLPADAQEGGDAV